MRLTLAYHPVTDVRFGATTQLQGTTLEVSEAALRQYLLEDRQLELLTWPSCTLVRPVVLAWCLTFWSRAPRNQAPALISQAF